MVKSKTQGELKKACLDPQSEKFVPRGGGQASIGIQTNYVGGFKIANLVSLVSRLEVTG